MADRHLHEFHALSWHMGPYGRQDIHLHPCDCHNVELVGVGRECDGVFETHKMLKLSASPRAHWSDKENEGVPL